MTPTGDAIDQFLAAQRRARPHVRIDANPAWRPYGAEWRALCAELGVSCHDDVTRLGDVMVDVWPFFRLAFEGTTFDYALLTPDEARSHRAYLVSLLPRYPTLAPRTRMLPLFGQDGNLLLLDELGQVHTFWFYEEARTSLLAASLGELLARTLG